MYPISDTVRKLQEAFDGSQGIDVYEIDSLQEVIQTFQNVAPVVVITSDPRKMIQFQALNKKVIKKTSSKTILITGKQLNAKAERKFSQLGLSDYIKEPIAPKTLYYKINLMLKSLPKRQKEGDDEYEMREAQESAQKKQEELELRRQKAEERRKQEGIDTQMRGEISPESQEQGAEIDISYQQEAENTAKGELAGENNYQEEDLGGNYEGKGEGQLEDLEGNYDAHDGRKTKDDIIDDMTGESNYRDEIPEENQASDIATVDKSIDDNPMQGKSSQAYVENMDPLRGDLDTSRDEIEYEDEPNKKKGLNLAFDEEEDPQLERPAPIEYEEDSRPNINLDIQDDLNEADFHPEKRQQMQDIEDPSLNMDHDLDVEDEPRKGSRELSELDPEYEEEMRRRNLDMNLMDQEIADELRKKRKMEQVEDFDLDATQEGQRDEVQTHDATDGAIDHINDPDLKGRTSFEEGDLGNEVHKNRQLNPDIQIEDEELNPRRELQPEFEEEHRKRRSMAVVDDIDLGNIRQEHQNQEEDGRNANFDPAHHEENEMGSGRNRADEIDTYMRSPNLKKDKGLDMEDDVKKRELYEREMDDRINKRDLYDKQLEDDWGFNKDEELRRDDDFIPEEDDNTLTGHGPQDRGEQTIDYGAIKKAYEEGGSGDEAFGGDGGTLRGQKQYEFETGEGGAKEIPTYGFDEENPVVEEETPPPPTNGTQYYYPDTNGIEFVVRQLEKFRNKKLDHEFHLENIANVLKDEKKGLTTFYYYNPSTGDPEKTFSLHDQLSEFDPEIEEKWQEVNDINYNRWKESKVPEWQDHTFQIKENNFIFPYYEGADLLALAVVTFDQNMSDKHTKFIELQLECARGIFLEKNHLAGGKFNVNKSSKSEAPGKKKSFFKGLFGRKAA